MNDAFLAINSNMRKYAALDDEELKLFNSQLILKEIPRKHCLLSAGEVCNFEAYIVKGCIRTYYIEPDGNEFILQFAVEDWWVSDIASFNTRTPSQLYIESTEPCTILMIPYEVKEQLLSGIPKLERVFRIMIQRNLTAVQNRLIRTVAYTAAERYKSFNDLYPTISQRVPQRLIASYLGISPEFLSKIRSRK